MMSGLLGINLGCDNFFAHEYGCPEISYRIKGTVVNDAGQPIPGIGVSLLHNWYDEVENWRYDDTTDANGHYDIGFNDFNNPILVDFRDIDADENGNYFDTTVSIRTDNVPLVGGDGRWNEGTGFITKNVTLKTKPLDQE